jgi:15-cis-phytoene desaturase
MSKHVAIAGGGLAGLTCAKYLVDAGCRVSVFESLPFLGGRASTFRDADGEWIEQGLHLFLGVYSEFQALLREISRPPSEVLFWMETLHMQDPGGPQAVYGVNPLRAPVATLVGALGQNDYLSLADKLGTILPLTAPALANLETIRRSYDGLTVTQWWQEIGGSEDVMERVLRPVCRGIQFTDPDEFSAYDFLGWAHHAIYHLPNVRLAGYVGARDETIFAPLGAYLARHGATVRTQVRLTGIDYRAEQGSVAGILVNDDERIEADAYVVALPAWNFTPLIPSALRHDPFFERIAALPVAPAISVQLWFDRPITGTPEFFLLARSNVPVYQEQSPQTYPVTRGSRLSMIVAPADTLLGETDANLTTLVVESLKSVNEAVAGAEVTKSVVLKHRQHLIRPLPGAMSARPTQKTPVSNLFLAGDWTQQDFFGSQEGAVRGGKYCAAAVREYLSV